MDLDETVARAAGRPVAALFAERGETAFRALEAEALAALLERDPRPGLVIALGGGALGVPASRDRLRARAAVIWLRVAPGTAAGRLGAAGAAARPLLALAGGDAPEGALRALLAAREATFAGAADAEVETDGRTPEEVADEAADRWRGVV